MMKVTPTIAVLSVAATVALFPACKFVEWHYIAPDPSGGTSSSTGSTSGMGGTGGGLLCAPGSTQPCYDGPPGTKGVGVCQAGAQTCAANGMSWGPCVGEVVPKLEDCAKPQDEDCDGNAPTCQGNLLWAKRFGDAGNDQALGIAVDAAGSVLVTGNFSGAVDFGGGVLTSAGGADVFVVKLDASGGFLWSKRFGGAADDGGTSVAVDAMGNVVVTGYFAGVADFSGGMLTSAGAMDIFVVKLDGSGNPLWSKRFGGTDIEQGTSVAVDGSGSVVVTGYTLGSLDDPFQGHRRRPASRRSRAVET